MLNIGIYDCDQNNSTDPNGKRAVKRCHCGAVIINTVYFICFNLYGASNKFAKLICIFAHNIKKCVKFIAVAESVYFFAEIIKLIFKVFKH